MAFDAFVEIDGIPGESTDAKYSGWIEATSFHFGVTQTASATDSSAGGGTSERADFQDFSFEKLVDKATPLLLRDCAKGKVFSKIKVVANRAGGSKTPFLTYTFEECVLSSVSHGGGGGSDFPSESVSVNFAAYKLDYDQQDRKTGSSKGKTSGGYDLKANQEK